METHSSLVLHATGTFPKLGALLLLGALSACGGDDGGGTTGPGDSAPETAVGHPDGAGGDDSGSGSDASTGAADGMRDSVAAERDAASADAPVTPPGADARTDGSSDAGAIDASTDAAPVDTSSGDANRVDANSVDASGNDAAPGCTLCATYGQPEQAGKITSATLNALSGISVSQRNTGVVYVHNDRNVAQFFAVSEPGALLGTFTLTGATVEDIEDMAVAHCPTGSCVYLADIGGNITPRTQFAVVRAPEPEVHVDTPVGTVPLAAERLVFSYPDGANHNAESMLIDPASETIYVITKLAAGMPSAVYRIAATFGGSALTAEKVADLSVPKSTDREATSASAHPCAPAFLLRTYNTLYEFRAAPGAQLEAAFSATPVVVPVATETQGEGVAYRPDGRGYFTTTEGSQPALNRVSCP